jgi:hypothetical protein
MKHLMFIAQIVPLEDGTFGVGFSCNLSSENMQKLLKKANNDKFSIEVDLID